MLTVLTLIGAFVVLAIGIGVLIVVYYAISYLVLSVVSRLFPLTGRRHRGRSST